MATGSRTLIFAFENATPSRVNHRSSRPPSTRDTLNSSASSQAESQTNSRASVLSPITSNIDTQERDEQCERNQ